MRSRHWLSAFAGTLSTFVAVKGSSSGIARSVVIALILAFPIGINSNAVATGDPTTGTTLSPSLPTTCPAYRNSKHVIYIDDAGYPAPDRDPNGIQDLSIVVALDKAHPETVLLAIGISEESSGVNDIPNSVALAKKVTSASGQPALPVFGATASQNFALEKQIIFHAHCLNAVDKRLHVAIGGEWAPLKRAIERDDAIRNYINVVGITGSNIDNKYGKKQAYDFVFNKIGGDRIVEIDQQQFRVMYVPGAPPYDTSNVLNDFYNRTLLPVLRSVVDRDNTNVTDRNGVYIRHTIAITPGTHYLRIADFMTIAHIIWSGDAGVYDQAMMYGRIETAFRSLSSTLISD